MIVKNDNTNKIIIKIDSKQINHKLLNKYISELEQLNAKYSIISAKDGVIYGR